MDRSRKGWCDAASSSRRRAIGGMTALLCLGWAAPRAVAQESRRLDRGDRAGKVMGVAPGRLQVRLTNSGDTWLVQPGPKAVIEVTGTASRQLLAPKQFVQCAVELDATGKVTAPVETITFTGGGTPAVAAAGLDVADTQSKRPTAKRPAGSYLVSGVIKTASDETIVVKIGRERFDIPVGAETKLEVRTPNLAVAAVGDDVEVEGDYVQKGQLLASSIKVSLANPLEPPQKGKRRPAGVP